MALRDVSPGQLAMASVTAAAGSFVQAGIGFGSLLFAAPLLVPIEPRFVPVPVLVPGFVPGC